MNDVKCLLTLLLLASTFTLALCEEVSLKPNDTQAIANASLQSPSNETELMTFVESAVAHAHDVGKPQAIKDFMNLKGPWVRGETYIFAHDFNGTTLCLPYLPTAVGTNRLGVQDAEGRYINRDMQAIAMNGSGFYHYLYRNPVTNQTDPKVSYVMKVDDTWWLGSGIYLPVKNEISVE
jgi:signal transduction histidine kinase